jgi:transcriptional regulator of arginine metabolism
MTKQARQYAIKEIINSKAISNQDELRLELKKRGFDVTQATLSRDLKELGVGRVATSDGAKYVLPKESEVQILRPVVGAEVVSITSNENMIVVKTLPGCANVVGEFIDVLKNPDIIGTIAGDNTLLVIPKSQAKTKQLEQLLKQKLIEGK